MYWVLFLCACNVVFYILYVLFSIFKFYFLFYVFFVFLNYMFSMFYIFIFIDILLLSRILCFRVILYAKRNKQHEYFANIFQVASNYQVPYKPIVREIGTFINTLNNTPRGNNQLTQQTVFVYMRQY